MSGFDLDPSMIAVVGGRLIDLRRLAADTEYPWPEILPHLAILLDFFIHEVPADDYFGVPIRLASQVSWFVDAYNGLFDADDEKGVECPPAPPRRRKTPIAPDLRRAVYERDDYRCVKCGERFGISCDHIHPESKGGATTLENLRTLCMPCNLRKGATIEGPILAGEGVDDGQA